MPAIRLLRPLTVAGILMASGIVQAQETIKIGVITDRVGGSKFYAEPVTRGVELGARLINENGGALGKRIQLS